jgi:hypothetical protein
VQTYIGTACTFKYKRKKSNIEGREEDIIVVLADRNTGDGAMT